MSYYVICLLVVMLLGKCFFVWLERMLKCDFVLLELLVFVAYRNTTTTHHVYCVTFILRALCITLIHFTYLDKDTDVSISLNIQLTYIRL